MTPPHLSASLAVPSSPGTPPPIFNFEFLIFNWPIFPQLGSIVAPKETRNQIANGAMKTIYSKIISLLLLLALTISSTGCMTCNLVEHAQGYTREPSVLLANEKPIEHKGLYYVDHRAKEKEAANPSEAKPKNNLFVFAYKPHAGYYALTPLSVCADAATLPIQGVGLLLIYWYGKMLRC